MNDQVIPNEILNRLNSDHRQALLALHADMASAAERAGAKRLQFSTHDPHADRPWHFSLQGFGNTGLVYDANYGVDPSSSR